MRRIAISYPARVGTGNSAEERYRQRYRAWRSRMRLAVLLAMLPVPAIMLALTILWPYHREFALGVAVGSIATFAMAVTLATPEHIERWAAGSRS